VRLGMIERGVVRAVTEGTAEVEVTPAFAEACASCGICAGGPERRILVLESAEGLEPGARVVIELETPPELKSAVIVFFLPVVALLAGAVVGARVPGWLSLEAAQETWFAVMGAALFFGVAFLGVRAYDRAVSTRSRRPRIVRIEG